jgi:formate hydrogenlyase subunit 6/NADH:ubiquinone oxidoreductase subunit I
MNGAYVLPDRATVDRLRLTLARGRALYEVRVEAGGADWQRVSGQEPFDWAAPLPLAGAKRFFFPPRETLVRWRGTAAEETLPVVDPFILFGVHPCDLAAIAVQDRFFAGDPWYERRRAAALLVGLDCLAACAGGFCWDVDAGPFARGGFDLALTPLVDGRVFVRCGTAGAEAILTAADLPARAADPVMVAACDAAEAQAILTFPARPAVARTRARLDAHQITDAEWQALGPACFACTGCTNLCPTCSCFTVVDEVANGGGARMRDWDSCLLAGFQREASGHHPAPRAGDRVRRFWSHKLSADFVPELGRIGCVGCGRCDVTCPGSIGALAVTGALGSR